MPTHRTTRAVRTLIGSLMLCLGGCGSSAELPSADLVVLTGALATSVRTIEEPITGPLDIHDAVARAIKYNATIRSQELIAALAEAKARAQSISLLPSVVAESELYGRSKPALSRSNLSSTYSTSSEVRTIASDLTLSLNILDFGLSYLRTEQAADKAEKEREEVRRVTLKVIEDTRSTYWRAVVHDSLIARLDRVRPDVERMLAASGAAARDINIDPLVSLNYERDVLNLQRELNQLRTSLVGAKEQLKQLMGVPQDVTIQLLPADRVLKLAEGPIERDVLGALESRHEIRQVMHDMRITDKEVHATLLQLLPGISLSRGVAHDTNSFLLNASWVTLGAKVAWNLINLAHLPRDLDVVEAQQRINRQQAMAIAVAIAMQVYVSRSRIEAHRHAARDASVFADMQKRMLRQVRSATTVGTVALQALTKERLATLLAEVRSDLARADLHAAAASYFTAIGQGVQLDFDLETTPVATLAEALRNASAGASMGQAAPAPLAAAGRF